MKYFFLATAIFIGIFLASFGLFQEKRTPQSFSARLGGEALTLEVVDTELLRERGLSGRSVLAENQGMFFIFPKEDLHGFWMKDMRFPIDILWLDYAYRIVDVEEQVTPDSYPRVFRPQVKAHYAVELPAGFFSQYHLMLGMKLEIIL